MSNFDSKPIVIKKSKPHAQTTGHKPLEDDATPQTVSREVAKGIIKFRSEKNLTQKDLATKANIPVKILADWENGKGVFNQSIAEKLQRVLGVDLKTFEKTVANTKKK